MENATEEVNLGLSPIKFWQKKGRGHSRQKEEPAQRHGDGSMG